MTPDKRSLTRAVQELVISGELPVPGRQRSRPTNDLTVLPPPNGDTGPAVEECFAEARERMRSGNGTHSSESQLPFINVGNRQLREISTECLNALRGANNPPKLFVRSGRMVWVIRDEKSRYVISDVTESVLRGRMARSADYFRPARKADAWVQVPPPLDVVRDILACPPLEWGLPRLEGVIESPALRPDGTIIESPGYDVATGLYYVPAEGLRPPKVPENPTPDDASKAMEIIDDAIGQFPFVDDASKANAIASMLTPICRPAISGPTPLALYDATAMGTGKTLLSEVGSIIATGREGALFSAPNDADEWRKKLTSVLKEGATVVVIDNVNHRLDSGELCMALTAKYYADRILGTNTTITLPVQCSWIATGNNIQLGGDMPRRCYWIRMDAQDAKPFERTGFKHENLKAWVTENRGGLLTALLTIARAWFVAGRPSSKIRPLGSFESWSTTIGGMLEHAGIQGFLANSHELYAQADGESGQWEGFLQTLDEVFYSEPFLAAEVGRKLGDKAYNTESRQTEPTAAAMRLREALPERIAAAADKPGPLAAALGRAFSERTGRRFGESGVYIQKDGVSHKVQRWKVTLPAAKTAKSNKPGG
jgi:hypothetical protein